MHTEETARKQAPSNIPFKYVYEHLHSKQKKEAQSSQRNNVTDWLTWEYAVQSHLFSHDANSIQVTPGGCPVVPEMILE